MQGIETRKHKKLLQNKEKLEQLLNNNSAMGIDDKELIRIQEQLAFSKDLYDYYQILMNELSNCIKLYNSNHQNLQPRLSRMIRKLNR